MDATPGTTQSFKTGAPHPQPGWLGDARAGLAPGLDHVAWQDDDGPHTMPLREGWTRLGRSLSAHIRLDDSTVSRRHALIHVDEDGARLLDDRSLNGVLVNGERVEWHELEDGDELVIGRFRIWFLRAQAEAPRPPGQARRRALA